jgi:SAM-dependent MidA family methyltransferase
MLIPRGQLRILPETRSIPAMKQADTLPAASAEALAHSGQVAAKLRGAIAVAGGWLPFARFMEIALYAPGLGYYSAGARKLGSGGDFITAPELSPLFGHTLARQIRDLIEPGCDAVLEIGAGSGALAATLLDELERLQALPQQYLILELSADLRERSRDTIAARVPHLMERVAWLNRLPPSFAGVALGNEVLDAMPVHLVQTRSEGDELRIDEIGVTAAGDGFAYSPRPAQGELLGAARALKLPAGYRTEIGLDAQAFIRSLAQVMERGVALFIDYGFPAREYYHAERREGTLMCHYRHRAHDDPFFLPGLQDITSHVDFSAVARSARESGMAIAGYTGQAQFLVNCGITDVLAQVPAEDPGRYLPLSNQANRLLSPAEMGELFKVIALARNWSAPLRGFAQGDRTASL